MFTTEFLIPMPPRYHADVADAKALDVIGRQHGQPDPDHHLCCQQRYHQRDGMLLYQIYKTIYGYQFGDTHNDGTRTCGLDGLGESGSAPKQALWHVEDPTRRGVRFFLEPFP